MKTRRPMAAAALLTILFAWPVMEGCKKKEPVRIGFVGGLTGRNGDLGVAGRDGAILAVETINAGGGINGKKIALVIRDDKSDPEEAKKVVKGLVSENVAVIVGPMTSVVAVATIPIGTDARTLMISPTVSSADLSGKDDYFLRLNLNRDSAAASADYLAGKLGIKRAAIAYDMSNRSYTVSLAEAFKKRFSEYGGAIVDEQAFNAKGPVDFLALARKVAARKPPSIFIVAGAVDSAMICQQLKKIGSRATVFIAEWGATPEFLKGGGKAVENVYIVQHYNSGSTDPAFKAFKEAYQKRFGDQPAFAATYSYETVMIIAEALRKNPDPVRLKDTILTIGTFRGLQSPIAIDRFGDPLRPSTVTRVEGGRFVPQE
jgi:branched-chain amino acid transport system substrate-binding protein